MTARIPEISGSAIVLIGNFNPSIFQPQWFVRQGLLPDVEGENADIKIMAQQVCHFETDRFILLITPDRFTAISKPNTSPAPLRDLVAGTFFILEHTPVTAMGLNHQMHFAMGSTELWHKVGDTLAPKDGWNEVLGGRPGLLSMTIRSELPEVKGGLIHVKVEPSTRVKEGVYFEANEHYPAPDEEPLKALLARMLDRWEDAQIYATRIVDHILTYATR
jgi:hypothetical protein